MLNIEMIGKFNPFDFIHCPACNRRKFTSLSYASVWCDKCSCEFSVRHTAGDPGCVVDAKMENGYGPAWECKGACNISVGTLEKDPKCPHCKGDMLHKTGFSLSLPEEQQKKSYYWILKLGDYSSGWLESPHANHIGEDRQEEWDQYQKIVLDL